MKLDDASEARLEEHARVISGYENDKGDIFVEFLLAEGDTLNKSIVNGLPLGYTSDLLERWHTEGSWVGVVHNAHPTKNHPLVFEGNPPMTMGESSQVAWYKDRSAKWGFANYVSTKLKTLNDGRKQLFGTARITDENAKRAWREGHFPKFASSSVFIQDRNQTGFVTKGIPISCTSVELPAYPLDVAKIHNECHGGNECVHKIAESSYNCNTCRHEILTSFENIFSSNSEQKVSESSMTDSDSSKPKPNESSGEGDVKPALVSEEITLDTSGQAITQNKEETVDWEAKYKELEKSTKKKDREFEDYKTTSEERFMKIERKRVEQQIRDILGKVPVFVFDGKEENREAELKKYLKRYDGKNEEAIIEDVNDKYLIAMKVKEHRKVGESGMDSGSDISNFAPLVSKDGKADPKILDIHNIGGGNQ